MCERRRDSGVTLIELVLVLVVLGVVLTVITSVATVALRNETTQRTRTDDTRSLRGAQIWLSQDVAGVPPDGFDVSGAGSGCTGAAAGSRLVQLRWSEAGSGATKHFVADYRFVAESADTSQVARYTCSGTGAEPFGNTSLLHLTGPLATTAPTIEVIQSGGQDVGVKLTVFSTEGDPIVVVAGTRNPDASLPVSG